MKPVALLVLMLLGKATTAWAGEAEPQRLWSQSRNGYTLEQWEFYPDEPLAVKTMVLIPSGAQPGKTPAVICMNVERGSVEHLAGERDPYGTPGVDEGRKAYYAAKAGYVAMALALPGYANGAPDDIESEDSRRRYLSLLPDSGWTDEKLVRREVECCVAILKRNPLVDTSRISVMGYKGGAVIRSAAKGLPGVGVTETILPEGECDPAYPAVREGRRASGVREMDEHDYIPERPDGRTERTFVWAMAKLRANCRPRVPPMLKDADTFRSWLKADQQRWRDRFLPSEGSCEFRLLAEDRRQGYVIRTYEFYPFDGLAVKTKILVPDTAVSGKTPAVVCLPGTAGSLLGLAGETPNPYWDGGYPIRCRQAWWYCRAGMIAVALENPANASNAKDDIMFWKSQAYFRSHIGQVVVGGKRLDEQIFVTKLVDFCIDFIVRDPLVDPRKIAVSGHSLGAGIVCAAITNPKVAACCYNDYVPYVPGARTSVTRTRSNFMYGRQRGEGGSWFFSLAPKPLLLNEGGAWKGNLEYVCRAYELLGVPERLTIHHYDRYSIAAERSWDRIDLLDARNYTMDDFRRHNNCDAHDHSFHAESALPWLSRLFFGKWKPSKDLSDELLRAKAERYTSCFQMFPPDARRGRKAVGPLDRELTESDLVPERADGRTEMSATWVKMQIDRQKGER